MGERVYAGMTLAAIRRGVRENFAEVMDVATTTALLDEIERLRTENERLQGGAGVAALEKRVEALEKLVSEARTFGWRAVMKP